MSTSGSLTGAQRNCFVDLARRRASAEIERLRVSLPLLSQQLSARSLPAAPIVTCWLNDIQADTFIIRPALIHQGGRDFRLRLTVKRAAASARVRDRWIG